MYLRSWTRALRTGWTHVSPKGDLTLRSSVWGYLICRKQLWTSRFLNHFPGFFQDPVSSFTFTQTGNTSKCQEHITRIRWSGDWMRTNTGCKPYLTSMYLKLQWISFRTWINALCPCCGWPQKSCLFWIAYVTKTYLGLSFLETRKAPYSLLQPCVEVPHHN